MSRAIIPAICAVAGLPLAVSAQVVLPEVEPNETRAHALANGAFVLGHGDAITGTTTGSSTTTTVAPPANMDYFMVKTAPLAAGVYRHRLLLTHNNATNAYTTSFRGLSQSGRVIGTSELQLYQGQSSSVPTFYLQWYGFGKEEQMIMRIQGTASTPQPYELTLETESADITDLGEFRAGQIIITHVNQGHTTDTAIRVYDANFDPVLDPLFDPQEPGPWMHYSNHSEPAPGTTARSILDRAYAPGTYYLAVTADDLAVHVPAAADDRRHNPPVPDFPGLAVSSAQTSTANLCFEIVDQDGPVRVTSYKLDRHVINWFRFDVAAAPATGACCFDDGSCGLRTPQHCQAQNGIYHGDGTACESVACAAPGACCMVLGECSVMSDRECALAGGAFQGAGTSCAGSCPANSAETMLLPAHGSVQSSSAIPIFTRGMWFTAPVDFVITGLRVPDPTGHGTQHVEVVRVNAVIPASIPGTNDVVTLFKRVGVPSQAIIACNIPVQAGQQIGILGACGDASVMHHSLSPTPTFMTPVHGQNMLLRRLGTQHNIIRMPAIGVFGDSTAFARVEMYYAPLALPCYANCDGSTTPPVLNVGDFTCFLQRFAAGEAYANCDESTTAPVLNVGDFTCFLQKFAAGCP